MDPVFFGCLSANKPPAKPVKIRSFSFKKKTSSVTIDVATNRIMSNQTWEVVPPSTYRVCPVQ